MLQHNIIPKTLYWHTSTPCFRKYYIHIAAWKCIWRTTCATRSKLIFSGSKRCSLTLRLLSKHGRVSTRRKKDRWITKGGKHTSKFLKVFPIARMDRKTKLRQLAQCSGMFRCCQCEGNLGVIPKHNEPRYWHWPSLRDLPPWQLNLLNLGVGKQILNLNTFYLWVLLLL